MKSLIKALLIVLLCGFLAACGQKVKVFEDYIDTIGADELLVNCSDEVNKGESQVDAIGYLCRVHVDEKTVIQNENGEPVPFSELTKEDVVRIVPVKPQNIKKGDREFIAKEITVIK